MKKNNIFSFSFINYIIRFGIIELILIIIGLFFVPTLVLILPLSIVHLVICLGQTITLDPFQVVKYSEIYDKTPAANHYEKTEKYYYINEMKNYKINYMFITIYGNIEYRKKHINDGTYEEKLYKKTKVTIHRTFKNEKEFIEALNNKL